MKTPHPVKFIKAALFTSLACAGLAACNNLIPGAGGGASTPPAPGAAAAPAPPPTLRPPFIQCTAPTGFFGTMETFTLTFDTTIHTTANPQNNVYILSQVAVRQAIETVRTQDGFSMQSPTAPASPSDTTPYLIVAANGQRWDHTTLYVSNAIPAELTKFKTIAANLKAFAIAHGKLAPTGQ